MVADDKRRAGDAMHGLWDVARTRVGDAGSAGWEGAVKLIDRPVEGRMITYRAPNASRIGCPWRLRVAAHSRVIDVAAFRTKADLVEYITKALAGTRQIPADTKGEWGVVWKLSRGRGKRAINTDFGR